MKFDIVYIRTVRDNTVSWHTDTGECHLQLVCDEEGSCDIVERRFVYYLNDRSIIGGENIGLIDKNSGETEPTEIGEAIDRWPRPEHTNEVVKLLHALVGSVPDYHMGKKTKDKLYSFLACS